METLWASDGNIDESAASLDIRPDQVQAAIGYYTDYEREIGDLIASNNGEAARLREASERKERARRR